MRAFIIVFLCIVAMKNAISSDCKTISKDLEYHSSDFVFLGEVLTTCNTHFEVKIVEPFKGRMDEVLQVVIDDNSVHPKQGETWLFYSRIREGNNYISRCGWSRSLSSPFIANSEFFPAPPPLDTCKALLEVLNRLNLELALSELHFDIISLRQMNTRKELEEIKKVDIKILENSKKIEFQLLIFKWGSIALLIVFLGFKIFMKYAR